MLLCFMMLELSFAYAQTQRSLPSHYIKEYDNKNRLYTRITSIVEDSLGFVWMGTQSGLSRFDGTSFTSRQSDPLDSSTLINNNITQIALTKGGKLYLATKGGLDMYDISKEKFDHALAKNKKLSGIINDVFVSSTGELWCAPFNDGIIKIENQNNIKSYTLPIPTISDEFSSGDNIITIQEDRFVPGRLLAFGNNTIYAKSKSDQSFSIIYSWQPDGVDYQDFFTGVQITPNQFVISTWSNPLLLIDTERKTRRPISFDETNISLDHVFAADFELLSADTVLVNTWQNGLFYLIMTGGDFSLERLHSQPPKGKYIPGGTIHRGSKLTYAGGYHLSSIFPYPLVGHKIEDANKIESTKSLFYPKDQNCLYSGGLGVFMKQSCTTSERELFYSYKEGGKNRDFDIIEKIREDKGGNILFLNSTNATNESRLMSYGRRSNTITTRFVTEHKNKYASKITDFDYDPQTNQIWMLLNNYGIIVLDGSDYHVVRTIPLKEEQSYNATYSYILPTESFVWVGSNNGLLRIDRQNNNITHIRSNPTDVHSLLGNKITFLEALPQEKIIIGCDEKGIQIFNENSGLDSTAIIIPALLRFDAKFVYNAIQIKPDLVLVSCSSGLGLINTTTKDQKFLSTEELGNNYDFWAPAVMDNEGKIIMFWGDEKVKFDPLKSNYDNVLPEIRIHQLESRSGQTITNHPITLNQEVTLPYEQRSFSISFDVIDYQNPEKLLVKYNLIGVDKSPRDGLKNRQPFYTNIDPGTYDFEVISRTKGSSKIVRAFFTITILPPFWQTGGFIFLVLFLIGGLIYTLIRYKENEARKAEQIKSKYDKALADMEMQALRSQMNPHFLFNSLNSIKYYVVQEDKRKAALYIDHFSKLIRSILQNSRKSLIPLSDELEALNLYIKIEQLRFENAFEYQLNVAKEIDVDYIMIPPLIIQPYVENAIWHGLLHLDKKGKLTLDIEAKRDVINIIIEDNGIGRAQSQKIQGVRKSHKESLGLKLTKERMLISESLHGMNITFNITDLYINGVSSGTRVELNITNLSTSL